MITSSSLPVARLLTVVFLVCSAGASIATVETEPIDRDAWFASAHSADPRERVWALGDVRGVLEVDREVREEILLKLADESPEVREAAAYVLAELSLTADDESALAAALEDDTDDRVGGAIAYAIGHRQIVRTGLGDSLRAHMASSHGATRLFYAFALCRQTEDLALPPSTTDAIAQDAWPILRSSLKRQNGVRTSRVARALVAVSRTACAATIPKLAAYFRTKGLRAHNATFALEIFGTAAPSLAKAPLRRLHSADDDVRISAASELGLLGVGKPSIASALGRCARNSTTSAEVQRACIAALGRIGPAVASQANVLTTLTGAPDSATRRSAAWALRRVARSQLDALLPALAERDPELVEKLQSASRLEYL